MSLLHCLSLYHLKVDYECDIFERKVDNKNLDKNDLRRSLFVALLLHY